MKTTLLCLSCVLLSLACSMSRSTAATADNPLSLDVSMFAGVTIKGTIGKSYSLLFAPTLEPASLWQKLDTVVLTNAVQIWIDFDSPKAGKRFYRAEEIGSSPESPAGMVWIKPGTFTMGSPANELDRGSNEGPQTLVTISHGFWMGKYEVTQAEYEAVMGSNPSNFKGDLNRPVEQVSWTDSVNYCAKLTEREHAAGRLPAGYVYRLPTEAEWEYVARAGSTTRFSYGDDPGYTKLKDYAWYHANSGGTTHPVGQKLANAWGLYDMAGNVPEWCLDWFGEYPGGTDPTGPASGSYRAFRGGCWHCDAWNCRSANRLYINPGSRDGLFGFRVVLAPGQ